MVMGDTAGYMCIYCSIVRNLDRQVEELGRVPLPDDRKAVGFAATVVRDLVAESPTSHAGLVVEVTDGNHTRTAASLRPS